jgi:hypothetical protein
MNFGEILALAPKILPLIPQIEKAIATAQKIMADPDVKAALATMAQVGAIIEAQQKIPTVAEKPQVNALG